MPEIVLFIDDGGVMNDNSLRGEQWRRLVAEFFAPILGGAPSAWAEANWVVMNRMLVPDAWAARLRAASGYSDFERAYQLDWLGEMCALVGVARPSDEECRELAARAAAYITPRVRAAFPGAVEAIRALAARGYTLHTASGEPSTDLAGYLDGMGVREHFGRLYGPDLIDTFKDGPEYYERVFADAGVAPADALVVDDSPLAIAWATQAGAHAVLVGPGHDAVSHDATSGDVATRHVADLAELPARILEIL